MSEAKETTMVSRRSQSATQGRTKGFSLIEVMASVAMGSIMVFGVAYLFAQTARLQAIALANQSIDSFKQELLRTLSNDDAWYNTMQKGATNASNMACLTNQTPCMPNPVGTLLTLWGADPAAAAPYYDANDLRAGLTVKGERCFNFNPAGNDACPFRYELRWAPVCNVGNPNCINPQVRVTATLLYAPDPASPTKLVINTGKLSIDSTPLTGGPGSNCLAHSQIWNTPGDHPWVVPTFNRMEVSIWGGGGGGAAAYANWAGGCGGGALPGEAGENSNFGPVFAPGGPPGTAMLAGGQHFVNWCLWVGNGPVCGNVNWFDCKGTDGTTVTGGSGFDPLPFPPPSIPKSSMMCVAAVGMAGGLGGQSASQSGSSPGGGGAGGPPNGERYILGGAGWLFDAGANTSGGQGAYDPATFPGPLKDGRFNQFVFTPQTLAIGSVVMIHVGRGGNGANANTYRGGAGSAGFVKVVYW